jgi:hypothetical protein
MSRMIDLIRASAVPSNLMQSAAKGSLSMPAGEMIEILVYLALHNKLFGEQAQLTLAGWDEAASKAAAADFNTPKEVLDYFVSPANLRPILLLVLLANPSVSEESLVELVPSVGREQVELLLKSDRVNSSPKILTALLENPNLTGIQSETVRSKLEPVAPADENSPARAGDAGSEEDAAIDEGLTAYLAEHANEIMAEADRPFQPIGGIHEEIVEGDLPPAEPEIKTPAAVGQASGAATKTAPAKKVQSSPTEQRGSALQKISRLDIKGRIQLAMKGSKEERSLLIRDGTKIVALAVLDSPKISDGEVERFATQKNVLEAVLRGIPMKRRFAKNYVVIRNLVFNPRTPLDLSLGLMKNILVGDLRNLSNNKEVSDTVRKLATKMFKQKMDTNNKR